MQNSEKPKKKIPLFPKFKTTGILNKYNKNAVLSDSDILEDSSDYENNEESNNIDNYTQDNKVQKLNTINFDIDKSNINTYLTPRKSIDDFKDIEDYLIKSGNDIEKIKEKNLNKINDNKNKDGNLPDKNNNNKIINDFFINNEGDIELSENNIKDIKNKQKSSKNNNNYIMTNSLGPLTEEDKFSGISFINKKKSIFNSVKDLWKFQKILLENQIIDIQSK